MKKTGDKGELIATRFLESRGFHILERNWRGTKELRAPEIDIIAGKNDTIIIVEVKTVSSTRFGQPQEWITVHKRKRLADGARAYLASKDIDGINFRFDAILIDISVSPPLINHIENAFTLSDIESL